MGWLELNLPFLFSPFSKATDVAAEIKRKLDKKEKKRKKREKKLQEENGDANGDVEVSLAFSVWPRMFWFEIWPTRGPVSVYDMLDQPDSEPLAGPTQWTWSLKRVRHWSLSTDVLWHLIKAQPIANQESDRSWPNRNTLASLQVENGEADTPVVKKKKKKQAAEEMEVEAEEAPEAENGAEDTPAKKKKKRKSEAEGAAATDNGAEETETPAKKKKKQKTETVEEPEEETPEPPVSEKKKKKKKKEGAD